LATVLLVFFRLRDFSGGRVPPRFLLPLLSGAGPLLLIREDPVGVAEGDSDKGDFSPFSSFILGRVGRRSVLILLGFFF